MLKLPKIVTIFLMLYLAVFFYGQSLPYQAHVEFLYAYSFIAADVGLAHAYRLITYGFLHSSFTHLALNGLWFMVFGAAVAREMRAFTFSLFVVGLSAIAALAYGLLNHDSATPMLGASGVVSGLMGASLYILPQKFWHLPAAPMAGQGYHAAVRALLRRPQVQQFIVIFHLINVVMAFQPALFGAPGSIAWEAHIAGFWAGVLVMPVVRGRLQ